MFEILGGSGKFNDCAIFTAVFTESWVAPELQWGETSTIHTQARGFTFVLRELRSRRDLECVAEESPIPQTTVYTTEVKSDHPTFFLSFIYLIVLRSYNWLFSAPLFTIKKYFKTIQDKSM